MTLTMAETPKANVLLRQAYVVDPRTGIADELDVLVVDGEIAELGSAGTLKAPAGTETVEAGGKHLFPAFVDVYPGYANYLERRQGLHPRMFRLRPVS